jgi:hypothetical protein
VADRIRTGDRLDHKWGAEIASLIFPMRDLQGFSDFDSTALFTPKCEDMRGLAAIQALLGKKCLVSRTISN